MARRHRYRGLRVEERGYVIARVLDRETGEEVGVYKRLGRWRFYRDDDPVRDRALAATARRMLVAKPQPIE